MLQKETSTHEGLIVGTLHSTSGFAGKMLWVGYGSVLRLNRVLVLVSIRHVKERAMRKD